jgi:hypothetical protein
MAGNVIRDMAKKSVPAPVKRKERKNRVSLSFNEADYETLEQQAKEAQRPVATYAMILIQRQMALVDSPPRASRR